MLLDAYGTNEMRLQGCSGWETGETYAVSAVTPAPATRDAEMAMLRQLLAVRFHVRLHRERRRTKVMALVVSKRGARFSEIFHPLDPAPQKVAELPPGVVNVFVGTMDGYAEDSLFGDLSILAKIGSVPIVNQTGLRGSFEVDEYRDELALRSRPLTYGDVSRILEEDYGLALVPQYADFEVVVLDSAARPTGN